VGIWDSLPVQSVLDFTDSPLAEKLNRSFNLPTYFSREIAGSEVPE
jgi:hypothetical protein